MPFPCTNVRVSGFLTLLAQVRRQYSNGSASVLWLCFQFIFSKKYISNICRLIVIKFHIKHKQVGGKLHKVFGLVGLEFLYT